MKKDNITLSPFVVTWLTISAVVGTFVLLCLVFQHQIIGCAKSIWPYFDLI